MLRNFFRPEDTSWRERPWTTAGGRTKTIRELDDDHLRNIIFYLHREAGWVYNRQGHSSYDIIWMNSVPENRESVLEVMLREADYRKLTWSRNGNPRR